MISPVCLKHLSNIVLEFKVSDNVFAGIIVIGKCDLRALGERVRKGDIRTVVVSSHHIWRKWNQICKVNQRQGTSVRISFRGYSFSGKRSFLLGE
jgi:hypothetical protein